MTPLEDALARVTRLTSAIARPHALIGGVAMILRVRPRPTDDIDLVIDATREHLDAILEAAKDAGFRLADDPDARALAEEGLVQLSGPEGAQGFGVDLIFVDSPFLARVVSRATPVAGAAITLPVATVEDLLLLKLEAGRGIDLDDAIAIKDAFEESLDREYLTEQADAIGARRALDNLLDGTTR